MLFDHLQDYGDIRSELPPSGRLEAHGVFAGLLADVARHGLRTFHGRRATRLAAAEGQTLLPFTIAYVTVVGESEAVLGEIEVTARSRIAVSAFYVLDKADFGTFKVTKLRYHKTHGWLEDGHVQVNHFQLSQMKEFLDIISNLNLSDAQKTRLSLDNINVGVLLSSSKGAELMRELAQTPELREDIYALAAKRRTLAAFETMMAAKPAEAEWQALARKDDLPTLPAPPSG